MTASCVSPKDRDLYPHNETIMLWSKGGICDDTDNPEYRLLLPITSIEALTNRNEIFLQSIDFIGYDMADVPIEDDADAEKIYANEQIFGHAVSAIWQPNYFRPSVRIGGEDVASGISNSAGDVEFDMPIGLPMPCCLQINKVIKFPKDIRVVAAFAQRFKDATGATKFRNYPLQAIISFWHNNG